MNEKVIVALATSSRTFARLIELALPAERFDVRKVPLDAPDLVERLESIGPDAVVLREALGGGDDLQICERIKASSGLRRTLLVFAADDPACREPAIQHRANEFLLLPCAPAAVREIFEQHFQKKHVVLCVEDSTVLRRKIVGTLRSDGYEVHEAADGLEALDVLQRESVDLMISDLEMPRMDGFALCRAVKSDPRTGDVPVLICSMLSAEQDIQRGFDAGADDYLMKPIVDSELLSRVRRLLQRDETMRQERVLIADDSDFVRKMVRRALRANGFQILEAVDGREALDRIAAEKVDLVILDFEMPNVDGREAALTLRKDPDTAEIPIIFLTSRTSKTDELAVRSTGIQAFIAKPFQADRVVAEVERLLAVERLKRERRAMRFYLSDGAISAIRKQAETGERAGRIVTDRFRTILFSDIVGFTRICRHFSSREVVEFLNLYFENMIDVLLQHEAMIDKLIGDAIMALFGREEDGAHRAIAAGLQMVEASARLRERTGIDLHIRVGINSGHVILGDIGSRYHFCDYTVIGDNVNVAQRLEGAASTDGVLISLSTYNLVRKVARVEPLEPMLLKGAETPVETFRVLSIDPYKAGASSSDAARPQEEKVRAEG